MELSRVRKWAWATLILTMLVNLGGALVRATGSGAGCGAHWPLCNGDVVPPDPNLATLIEYSHRLSIPALAIALLGMVVTSFRTQPKGSPLRSAAFWTLVFFIIESLIGAFLVLFELVAHNPSLKRVVSMSAHLLNTFALLAAIALALHRTDSALNHRKFSRADFSTMRLPVAAAFLLCLTGMSGAIAALGDTLYSAFGALPLQAYLDGETPLILRLRLIHPVVAIATAVFLLWYQVRLADISKDNSVIRAGWFVSGFTLLEVALGFVNIYLKAPVWMQLVHLLVGMLLWNAFVRQCFLFHSKLLRS